MMSAPESPWSSSSRLNLPFKERPKLVLKAGASIYRPLDISPAAADGFIFAEPGWPKVSNLLPSGFYLF